MVNKYINTKEIIKEYQKAWWNDKYKNEIIVVIITMIIGILFLINGFIKNNLKIIYIISFIVMPILYLLMFQYKKKLSIKNELKIYESKYKEKEIKIRLDNSIKISINNEKNEIPYAKIKKYIETKNLIILLTKDNFTISLKKDSFTDANSEDCKNMLKEKLKVVK